MTLHDVKPNQHFLVRRISDDTVRLQAIRLGLCPGTRLECLERVFGGPVVVRFGQQELAIGAGLAKEIYGELVPSLKWEESKVAVS
ncbi:MAG: FeoA family protein [Limnochordia bacterium]|jgi:Fe2+ transport system protein FeoA